MSTTIRELLVAFGVDADTAELSEFDSAISSATDNMASAAKAAAILAAGIALVAGAIAATVSAVATSGDEAAKASKRVGVTTQEFQELSFAADRSGASIQDVETSLRRLAVGTDELKTTGGTAADALTRLFGDEGRAKEAAAKGQLGFLEAIADEMVKLEDETTKMAIANDIFGKGGAKLLPLLNEGGSAIRDYRIEAHELGLVLSTEGAAASEEFVDGLTNAKAFLTGLRNTLGQSLLPVLNELLQRFSDWAKANGDLIRQNVERWAKRIEKGIKLIGTAIDGLVSRIDIIDTLTIALEAAAVAVGVIGAGLALFAGAKAWAGISAGYAVLVKGITLIAGALGIAFWEVVLIIAAIAATIAGTVLIIDDLIAYFSGADSALGTFIEKNKNANTLLGVLARNLQLVVDIGGAFIDLFKAIWTLVGLVAGEFAEKFDPQIQRAIELMKVLGAVSKQVADILMGVLVPATDLFTSGPMRLLLDGLQGATASVQGMTDASGLAPSAAMAGGAGSSSVSNEVNVTVGGDANGQDIAAQVEQALERSNRDALAALAGAEV